jgi:uncharacterized protein (DUF2236 family)
VTTLIERPLAEARVRLGDALFARVAGPDGPQHRERIHGTPGPRHFEAGSPIQRVHGDASMFIGGLRALLLQSLHPLAMAAVDGHSGFRGDPWGRLQRTSTFLAVTTFGTVSDATRAVTAVRAIHSRVRGTAPGGRPYAADDPHLLLWVHVAEVDSFLAAHDRYGEHPLHGADRDTYVAQAAVVARALGAADPPTTEAGLRQVIDGFRRELEGTDAARRAARFLLLRPPVPLAMRPGYGVLAAAAVALLPRWARRPLRLPYLPVAEVSAVRVGGEAVTRTIRWAMRPA